MAEEDALAYLDKQDGDPASGWVSDDDIKDAISQIYADHPDSEEVDTQIDEKLVPVDGRLEVLEEAIDTSPISSVEANTLPTGASATAVYVSDSRVLELGLPRGAKGDKGEPGPVSYTFKFRGTRDVPSPQSLRNVVSFPVPADGSPDLWVLRYNGSDESWPLESDPEYWAFSSTPSVHPLTQARTDDRLNLVPLDVGAVLDYADDTIELEDHTLTVADRIRITAIEDTTGLVEGGLYWVVEPEADTFKVSLTEQGEPVNFGTADGTADIEQLLGGDTVLVDVSVPGFSGAALSMIGSTVSVTSHGLLEASRVRLSNINSTTGLLEDGIYWVVSPTANTFRLSLTENGDPLVFGTADGTADVQQIVGAWHFIGYGDTSGGGGTVGVDFTAINAVGDLLVGSAPDEVDRLGVGDDGQILTADSGAPNGLAWEDPPSDFPKYNVKTFGAVGNGVANDTAAIQAALAAANAVDGAVYFPAGTYLVSAATDVEHPNEDAAKAALVLPGSGITLEGDGPTLSVIKLSTASSSVFGDILYGQGRSAVTVRGIGFDGADARTYPVESTALQLDSCAQLTLEDVSIKNTNSEGAYLYQCDDSTVTRLFIRDVGEEGDSGGGLHLDSCERVRVSGVNAHTIGMYGVVSSGSSYVSLGDILAVSCGLQGVHIQATSSRVSMSNITSVSSGGQGVAVIDSTNVTGGNIVVHDSGGNGFYTYNAQGVLLTNLRASSSGEHGIRLDHASDVVMVMGEQYASNVSGSAHVTSGAILSRGVATADTPDTGDVLKWNGTAVVWEADGGGGGGTDRWVYYDGVEEEWPERPAGAGHFIWRSVGWPDAIDPTLVEDRAIDGDDWEPDPEAALP